MLRWAWALMVLVSGPVWAQQQMPVFEDQLYMIARAQEQRIKDLESQVQELKKQLEQAKDPPAEEKK